MAAIAKEPGNLQAYEWRGIAYGHKLDFDYAIGDFTKLIDIYPRPKTSEQVERLVGFYQARALYYQRNKDWARAVADYSKMLELAPSMISYIGRAQVYTEQGEYAKGISDYTDAIRLANCIEGMAVEARAVPPCNPGATMRRNRGGCGLMAAVRMNGGG